MKKIKKKIKKPVKSARAKLMAKKKIIKKKLITKEPVQEYYKVDVEVKHTDGDGKVLQYYYKEMSSRGGEEGSAADLIVTDLKRLGQGGRLILLDGTPEGKIIETWPSVTRALEIAAIENKELEKRPGPMVPSWVF